MTGRGIDVHSYGYNAAMPRSANRLVIIVPPAVQRSGHYAWTFKIAS